ncbi:MAG: hypothetical protein QM820_08095 [Minicystis sp.]
MSKRDVIDPELLRRFAWRTGVSVDLEPPPEPGEPAPEREEPAGREEPAAERDEEESDVEAARARWARARRAAAELAQDVARAWATTGRAAQTAATAAVLQRLRRSEDAMVVLRDHPEACLRLWRLAARHFKRLSPRGKREDVFALVAVAPPLDVAETAELLAEVIAAREVTLTAIMTHGLASRRDERRHPAINARLARLLAEGKTWSAREAAVTWLSPDDLDDAVPALRRALRQPRLALRARALSLLASRTPPALDADDVLWMLRDAHAHPLFGFGSNGQEEDARTYAEALLAVTVALRPAEGWKPLLEIVPWIAVRGEDLAGIDDAWAMRVLAAAYPAEGRATLDRVVLDHWTFKRPKALEAYALLPDADARPRLLEMAARPDPKLSERAKAIWFARFGEACPVGPLDGVPVSLLAGLPSERFLAAVAALRTAAEEARAALLRAMLDETPPGGAPFASLTPAQREALALWIFAARDLPRGTTEPAHTTAVADLLAERFGPAAFTGLAVLAERDARAGLDLQWLQETTRLATKLPLDEAERERLREIARIGLLSPAWDGALDPVRAADAAGLTPDIAARMIAILRMPEADVVGGRHFSAGYTAGQVLSQARDVPGLDAQLAAAAREAWEARAWGAFGRIAEAGCRCGVAEVIARVEQAVEALDDDPESFDGVAQATSGLAGRIDDAWLLRYLRRPESAAFSVAVGLVPKEEASLAVLDALRAALDTDSRAGASAAEAARKLLWLGAIGPEDRRLDGILERAPAAERGSLAGFLLHKGTPIVSIRRHLLDLLATSDYEAVEDIVWALARRDVPGKKDLYEDALPLTTSAVVRQELEVELGEPHEDETYWQQGDGEVDDELEEEDADA